MSIKRVKLSELSPEEQVEVEQALRDEQRYYSNEKDFFPWVLYFAICGAAAFLFSLFAGHWETIVYMFNKGDDLEYVLREQLEIIGIVGGLALTAISLWYGFKIHNRCGHLLLPGAVARIRGDRLIWLDASEAMNIELSTFTYGSEEYHTERTGYKLEARLADGTTFRMLSVSGSWLQKVKEHIEPGRFDSNSLK
jgi:hypothetical protein